MSVNAVISQYPDLVQRIVDTEQKFEEDKKKYNWDFKVSWDYGDVNGNPSDLYNLYKLGFLDMPHGAGGKRRNYCLKFPEETKKALAEYYLISQKQSNSSNPAEQSAEKSGDSKIIPDDLFKIIIGYDDLKLIMTMSIKADNPVHILFVGPPASAKSLFLMEIERLEGSKFAMGGSSTKAGLRDLLMEKPRYLILDEIDKINSSSDLSSLLSWMESGRVVLAKHGVHEEIKGKGWVFAACNRNTLPPELLSRFMVFTMKPYSKEDFTQIVVNIVQKENLNKELAEYLAEKLSLHSRDIRDAIKIARLAKTKEEIDKIMTIMEKYK